MNSIKNIIRYIPFIVWTIIIYILLTLPAQDFGDVEISIPDLDKIVHMGLFGGFVFFFGIGLIAIDKNNTHKALIIITSIACLYGIAIEYVQGYLLRPPRDYSYSDMLADAAGAAIGYFVVRWIIAFYQKRFAKNRY